MSFAQRANMRIAQANHARNIRDNFKCLERAYVYLRRRGWSEEGASFVVFGS